MMPPLSWRILGLAVIAVLLLPVVFTMLFWLVVALAAVAAIAALHLIVLPRWAARLGISTARLGMLLLPPLVALGGLTGGVRVVAAAAGLWLVAVALPGLALRALSHRIAAELAASQVPGASQATTGDPKALEGVACPRCHLISVHTSRDVAATCPGCGANLR